MSGEVGPRRFSWIDRRLSKEIAVAYFDKCSPVTTKMIKRSEKFGKSVK